eukprot:gene16477-30913_t
MAPPAFRAGAGGKIHVGDPAWRTPVGDPMAAKKKKDAAAA